MLSKVKDAIAWIGNLREEVVVKVMEAEKNLEGKAGPEKRKWVVDSLDELIKLPWWLDSLLNVDGYLIGMMVDKVCDALNILADGDFASVVASPQAVALASEAPIDTIIMAARSVASQESKQQTLDERLQKLYSEYGIAPEAGEVAEAEQAFDEEAEAKWNRCIAIVGVAEGGANFDVVDGKPILKEKSKNDRGGPTNYGITHGTLSRAYARGVVPHNDIVALTKDEAKKIFREMYCDPYGWLELPFEACLCMLDATINHGLGGTARIAQRACNAFGYQPELVVDGKWGAKTKAAVWAEAGEDAKEFARQFLAWRKSYFDGIIAKNASQDVFRAGWYNRLKRLASECGVAGPV